MNSFFDQNLHESHGPHTARLDLRRYQALNAHFFPNLWQCHLRVQKETAQNNSYWVIDMNSASCFLPELVPPQDTRQLLKLSHPIKERHQNR